MSETSCVWCSNPISKQKKFCDRECWLANKRKGIRDCVCLTCGTTFRVGSNRDYSQGKYCSHKCSGIAKRKPETATTRNGWYLSNGWNSFRACINTKRGEKCERCGAAKGERSKRLMLHHLIDPYLPVKSVELLLDESNVELLCAPCHGAEHRKGSDRECLHCGKTFNPGGPSQTNKYCSHPCYVEHKRKHRPIEQRCEFCDDPFTRLRKQPYCSSACSNRGRAR